MTEASAILKAFGVNFMCSMDEASRSCGSRKQQAILLVGSRLVSSEIENH